MRLLILCLILSGCNAIQPTTSTNPKPQLPGYAWYVRECGKCHTYYSPNNYTGSQWHNILQRKKNKVSLTAEQFTELEEYLVVNGADRN